MLFAILPLLNPCIYFQKCPRFEPIFNLARFCTTRLVHYGCILTYLTCPCSPFGLTIFIKLVVLVNSLVHPRKDRGSLQLLNLLAHPGEFGLNQGRCGSVEFVHVRLGCDDRVESFGDIPAEFVGTCFSSEPILGRAVDAGFAGHQIVSWTPFPCPDVVHVPYFLFRLESVDHFVDGSHGSFFGVHFGCRCVSGGFSFFFDNWMCFGRIDIVSIRCILFFWWLCDWCIFFILEHISCILCGLHFFVFKNFCFFNSIFF